MKNTLLFTLFSFYSLTLFSQGWEQTFGGDDYDVGCHVVQTVDGGYVVLANYESSFNGNKIVLIKTDATGNTLWIKSYSGSIGSCYQDNNLQQTTDGGFVIVGSLWVNGNHDALLIKTDATGDTLWTKHYNQVIGNQVNSGSVCQANDNGFVISGILNFVYGGGEAYLMKVNNVGEMDWIKTYPGMGAAQSVVQTTDNEFVFTTSIESFPALVKTDVEGELLWSNTYEGSSFFNSLQQTFDGGFIAVGGKFMGGDTDDIIMSLVKTNAFGDTLWTRAFGAGNYHEDWANSVRQTIDGGFIVIGVNFSLTDGYVWLVKTDELGLTLWSEDYLGNPNGDYGVSVQETMDGGYILTGGKADTLYQDRDVFLVKTDSQGNVVPTFEIPVSVVNRKLEKTIGILGREVKPTTNSPFIEIYDDGTVEKKVIIE